MSQAAIAMARLAPSVHGHPRHAWRCPPAAARRRPPSTSACAAAAADPPAAQDVRFERGSCYGCGAQLQLIDPELAGYVQPARYEVKRRHRQLDQLLCKRCQELSNGAMIPAVADFAQRAQAGVTAAAAVAPAAVGGSPSAGFEGKRLLAPEQLRQQLAVVRERRALVVLLVDLLDASGSLLGRVRELAGGNPILLVGTKADLLPAGADLAAVVDWLASAAALKKINVAGVHLVSSRTGAGVAAAAGAMRRERRGRDVYVMGAANVGKSAFIRALVRDMASITSRQFDPRAAQRGKYLPVESAMPGTTLQLIPMDVFASGGVLVDTPGLHLHHRMPHLLSPAENKLLHPRRRLRPYVPPSPAELAAEHAPSCSSGGSGHIASYRWGGLVRVDVLECPDSTQLVFYGPPALEVACASGPAAESSSGGSTATCKNAPAAAAAAFGAASVEARGGLRPAKQLVLRTGGSSRRALGDVAVSGVPGWLAVYASGQAGQLVRLQIWAPVGVEVFSRPALPLPLPFGQQQQQVEQEDWH